MTRRLTRWALRLLSLPLAFLLAIGVFTVVKNQGWLSPFGIESESHDSQVIQAIERTQEVSLLSLGIANPSADCPRRTAAATASRTGRSVPR